MFPMWLNDSNRLLFAHEGTVFITDLDGEEPREVIEFSPVYVSAPAISPDNRWIYLDRSLMESDIWMLTLDEERE
jgi:Tol biopolymer transport system component